jgi:hypothetical protein
MAFFFRQGAYMGMFSGMCKGCREAVNDGEDAALVEVDMYCGYGMHEGEPTHYWHKACYAKVLTDAGITMCDSADDRDQGMNSPQEKYMGS